MRERASKPPAYEGGVKATALQGGDTASCLTIADWFASVSSTGGGGDNGMAAIGNQAWEHREHWGQ